MDSPEGSDWAAELEECRAAANSACIVKSCVCNFLVHARQLENIVEVCVYALVLNNKGRDVLLLPLQSGLRRC